jgi:hypothetical protein
MEETITGLLASVASGRRYWGRAPQSISADTGPYLVLSRVDGVRDYQMSGASGYVSSRVQIDVYGKTYTATKTAARAAVAALSGQSLTSTAGVVQGIFVDSERDLPAADAGEVTSLFRTSVDIIVHHEEN